MTRVKYIENWDYHRYIRAVSSFDSNLESIERIVRGIGDRPGGLPGGQQRQLIEFIDTLHRVVSAKPARRNRKEVMSVLHKFAKSGIVTRPRLCTEDGQQINLTYRNVVMVNYEQKIATRLPPVHCIIDPSRGKIFVYTRTRTFMHVSIASSTGFLDNVFSCHPHSYREGHLCFGTMEADIRKAKDSLDIESLVVGIRNFLSTCNPNDTFGKHYIQYLIGDPNRMLYKQGYWFVPDVLRRDDLSVLPYVRWSRSLARWGTVPEEELNKRRNAKFYISPYEYVNIPNPLGDLFKTNVEDGVPFPEIYKPAPDIRRRVRLDEAVCQLKMMATPRHALISPLYFKLPRKRVVWGLRNSGYSTKQILEILRGKRKPPQRPRRGRCADGELRCRNSGSICGSDVWLQETCWNPRCTNCQEYDRSIGC